MFLLEKFKTLQYQLNISVEELKENYYTRSSSRLADPLTSPKTYWSVLKTFLNSKKIPCISPVVNQCFLLGNNSVLPTYLPQLTSNCLDSVHFSSSDIAKIIGRLDPDKVHGHDMLSLSMIKLCGNSICKSLSITFNNCLNEGKFPHEWKKLSLYPYIRKETNEA